MKLLAVALQLAPAPPAPAPPAPPPAVAPVEPLAQGETERVHWWARVELGIGSPGFSENSALLQDIGYPGAKLWVTLDGAWMFHERVGAGLLLGMNRQTSQPSGSPSLNAVSYFACLEVPVLLVGNPTWAFYLTPRGGYAAAELELGEPLEDDLRHTGTFGAAVGFSSFRYHLGVTFGWMHTPTGALGDLGGGMDFGGVYGAVGGTIGG